MSKVSGTYPSLSRGVNQQPFEARLDGQHGEQINLWSDPVHGLSRRRGTVLQATNADNVFGPSYFQLSDHDKQELRDFYASYRTVPYVTEGRELMVHYPTKPTPAWMQGEFAGGTGGIKVTRKIQGSGPLQPGAQALAPDTGTSGNPIHTMTWASTHKGFSAACQVGRYFVLCPNDTPFTAPAEVDIYASLTNGSVGIEVKQGVPNRTYKVTAVLDGVMFTYSYTVPSSAYSGTLDTSDIPSSDPEYQKKVNDRVNAYNSAVTAWITSAAMQARPAYIAAQLVSQMAANMAALGATISSDSNHGGIVISIMNGRAYSFSATDGGDNTQIVVTERVVTGTGKLTGYHLPGKIVMVKPERGVGSFYLKAVQDGVGSMRVRWEEAARTATLNPASPFIVLAVKSNTGPGSTVGYAPGNPAGLSYLAGLLNDATAAGLPQFSWRLVGDGDSSPVPAFFNKQITWMGMFQDRLCIAAGNVINLSEVGNYFNFWRTQTLTVPDKDPVEVYALGSETDVIRHSVIFDRSLLLFGDNQQYSIDGRQPVTPSTSSIIQSSHIEDTTDCPPVTGGSLVFFGKRREDSAEIFQMEIGDVADTSNFTGLGLQLTDYIPGKPAQILYVSSPSTLFVRTNEAPHSIWVFRFIDQGRQRIMDSWSRFDYHPAFGLILGMFYHDDAVYMRVAREAWLDEQNVLWTGGRGDFGFDVIERQSMLPQLNGLPHLDSIRPVASMWNGTGYGVDWHDKNYPFLSTAFTQVKVANYDPTDPPPPKYDYWLNGTTPNVKTSAEWNTAFEDVPGRSTDYCVTGLNFGSAVTLTSPVRRGQDAQPIMQGRLTVQRLTLYFKDTSGLYSVVEHNAGLAPVTTHFNGRYLGAATNRVGVVPVVTGNVFSTVGRDSKEYTCTIKADRWLPLSITRITWTGQWFMNHRFV